MSGRGGKDKGGTETETGVQCSREPGFSLLVVAVVLLRRHHLWFSNFLVQAAGQLLAVVGSVISSTPKGVGW